MTNRILDPIDTMKETGFTNANLNLLDQMDQYAEAGFVPVLPFRPPLKHLRSLYKDINDKLYVKPYTIGKPQDGSPFELYVRVVNLNTGFGVFKDLLIRFIPRFYTEYAANETGKKEIHVLLDAHMRTVSFQLKAVHSQPPVEDGEPIGILRITGKFESLPWVKYEETVSADVTAL
jgi:hypothetical protein